MQTRQQRRGRPIAMTSAEVYEFLASARTCRVVTGTARRSHVHRDGGVRRASGGGGRVAAAGVRDRDRDRLGRRGRDADAGATAIMPLATLPHLK